LVIDQHLPVDLTHRQFPCNGTLKKTCERRCNFFDNTDATVYQNFLMVQPNNGGITASLARCIEADRIVAPFVWFTKFEIAMLVQCREEVLVRLVYSS
jgi:hypothetical protein